MRFVVRKLSSLALGVAGGFRLFAGSVGKTTESPRTEYEATLYISRTLPEWLARKTLLQRANMLNFEKKLRTVDDHITVRSWTWDIACVETTLGGWVENGSIERYELKVEKAWSTFGTGKLSDFFEVHS